MYLSPCHLIMNFCMLFNGIITTKILISIIIITTLFRDQLGGYLNSEIQNQEENTRKEQKRFRCCLLGRYHIVPDYTCLDKT